MTKLFYSYPVGHTDAENLVEEFNSWDEAVRYCDEMNKDILAEYDSEEAWKNDPWAVEWEVYSGREVKDLLESKESHLISQNRTFLKGLLLVDFLLGDIKDPLIGTYESINTKNTKGRENE